MGEIINNVMYGILAVPVFVGVLYWIFTLIFSPIIVANNVLNGFIFTEKVKKAKVKKAKVKKATEDLYPLVHRLFIGSTGSPPTADEFEKFSKLSKKEILEISKTTTTYDPRYRIEDTLNFVD